MRPKKGQRVLYQLNNGGECLDGRLLIIACIRLLSQLQEKSLSTCGKPLMYTCARFSMYIDVSVTPWLPLGFLRKPF